MGYPELALHVAGRWLKQGSGGERPVQDPADGRLLAVLPLAGEAELVAAAEAADVGFRAWRRLSPHERYGVLRRAAQALREQAPALARVLTQEQGKPLAEATREVTLSADILDVAAEEGKRLQGHDVAPRVPGILSHQVRRRPIGPVAAFTPWNFPVNLPVRKLGSALAAGCSVVLKADEHTPGCAVLLVKTLLDAGVPAAALNLVFGHPPQVSSTLIAHPAIRKVSLTGSVTVGQQLGAQAAAAGKRFAGELGGHAPVIVCPDADLGFVLKQSIPAKFRNAGQVCASPIRFYLPRDRLDGFAAGFARAAAALRLGPGLDAATQMGPLTHPGRLDDMDRFVDDAAAHGARPLTGGTRRAGPGHFFEPTVYAAVDPACRLLRDEPFGPIAVLQPYDTLDDAIAQANALPYGLAAYAFTRDIVTVQRLADELDAGMLGINHFGVSQPELPFGGIKASGPGLEMGAEGVAAYTELTTLTIGMPE